MGKAKGLLQLLHNRITSYNVCYTKLLRFMILGTSTWGIGNLQDDFEMFVDLLLSLDLTEKTFALFGLGDQQTYPDSFCNGMGKLYRLLKNKDCKIIGSWPAEDYDFSA